MKKGLLLLPFIAGIVYVTLSSNSAGYTVDDRSGGSSSSPGCAGSGCHSSSATAAIVDSVELDSAGVSVTKYQAGKTYTIKFRATNTSTTDSLPKFGFHISVVKSTAAASVGTIGTVAGAATMAFGSVTTLYQTSPMSPASGAGGTGTVYLVSLPWTAPTTAGSGSIKVCGVINAVNGNAAADNGDKWNAKSAVFAERIVSAVPTVSNTAEVTAFPNPVSSNLTIALSNAASGVYTAQVFDLSGKSVISQNIEVNGSATASVNMQNLAAGIYQLVVGKDGNNKVISVVKQ